MEKTLSLGALEELSEKEIMVTEGGVLIPPITVRYTNPKACVKTCLNAGLAAAAGASGGGGIPGAAIWGGVTLIGGVASDVIDRNAYVMVAVGNTYCPVIF